MAEKLSWTELRRALAARSGVSEKEAGAFLNAFSSQLTEALKSDKQVKVNGLGTFKLLAVAPRKSVDVSTGEEITIEGYNKIVFAPEAGVKELIESQKTKKESMPTEVDPLKKLGAQAEEIVDILGDLGQSPKEEEPEPQPAVEEPKPVIEEPQPVVEEPKPFVYTPQPVVEPEPEIIVQEPKKKKKNHFFRDVLICLIILLLLLFGAYFFFRSQISGWIDHWMQPAPEAAPQTEVVEEPAASSESLIPEGNISQEQILAEFLAVTEGADEGAQELEYAGWITEEPMHEASRLAWMAYRYYGAKIYWPYLYDTNRDRVSDPNMIRVGTPIRVPKLTAAQKDTTNAQTIADLERLRKQAEAAMR